MLPHDQRWFPSIAAGIAAVTVAALAGIFGAPAWLIALAAAAGLLFWLWVLARADRAARADLDQLSDAVDELRLAANSTADTTLSAAGISDLACLARRRIDALVADHARLTELFSALDEPVIAADDAGRVSLCNPAAERLLGQPAADLVGRPVEEAFTLGDLVRLHGLARAGHAAREQIRVPSPKGAQIWEVAATPVGPAPRPEQAGRPVILSIRDVTELSRTLQVKTNFVANASHELRTPIASLRVAVDTLAGLPDEDRRMRERLVGMMAGSIARLEDLIRDLLDLSRLESEAGVRLGPVDAGDLAAVIRADLERVCRERRIELSFELAPELRRMRSDRNLLLLILMNLVDNAAKFAFEGTTVRIVGSVWPGPAGRPGVRFEVVDQGVGIPLEEQQRVFERFYQIDQARTGATARRGTGLGLAIVKHAVRRLGGSIRLTSVWQKGTTITVELPDSLGPN